MNINEFVSSREKYLAVQGDCLEGMKSIMDNSLDSAVSDPPYGLSNGVDISEVMRCWLIGKKYEHDQRGFFGAEWDSFIPGPEYWKEVFRVLKPGGHLLAFSSSRTFDLLSMAIRFAGFENRDTIIHQYGFELNLLSWIYRQGAVHGQNIPNMIDDFLGAIKSKSGAKSDNQKYLSGIVNAGRDNKERIVYEYLSPVTKESKEWRGWGTTLKPSHEVILVFRKPLSEKTIAENVLKYKTGGLNVDACHVGNEIRLNKPTSNDGNSSCSLAPINVTEYEGKYVEGRWPTNFIASHTPLCKENACLSECPCRKLYECDKEKTFPRFNWNKEIDFFPFYYCAKASTEERNIGCDELPKKSIREQEGNPKNWNLTLGTVRSRLVTIPQANVHPSVKPINIMKWCTKLVTPPNGIVLDPFAGSFSTGLACLIEGFRFIGFEMDENYYKIGCARMKYVADLVKEEQ